MATNKRFYWLKLNESFFDDDIADFIENQDNGKEFLIFYLKLCCKSLKNDGSLIQCIGETFKPYDNIGLARITHTNLKIVDEALKLFLAMGIIEKQATGELYLTQVKEMTGSECDSAKRVRESRAKNNFKNNNVTEDCYNVTEDCYNVQKCNTESRDKRIELRDKEKDKDCNSYELRACDIVYKKPNIQEVFNFYHEQKLNISPENFFKYNEVRNWIDKRTGQPIKDWKLAYLAMNEQATPDEHYNEDLTLNDCCFNFTYEEVFK